MQEQNIKLFQEAINEQYEAIKYYGDMKKQTKDSNNMAVIDQIQKDKMKHMNVLQEIYAFYKGIHHQPILQTERTYKKRFIEEVEESLFHEGKNLKFYQSIYFGSTYAPIRDRLHDLLLDLNQHTNWLTYMYAKEINR